jgi:hypothetical protein
MKKPTLIIIESRLKLAHLSRNYPECMTSARDP